MKKIIKIFNMLLVFGFLCACAPTINLRGNHLEDEAIKKVTPGEQTRSEILELFGSPSTRSNLDVETWYYISSYQKKFAFYEPEELERQVVAISFNKNGVVKEIRYLDKSDGKEVYLSEEETPTSGHDLGVVEQVIGNVGRFKNNRN